MTFAETRCGSLNETIASFQSHGSCLSDEESSRLTQKAELEDKIRNLEADLRDQREQSSELREDILSLQDEVERLTEREAELKRREVQTAFKLRDARRTRAAENDIARLKEDVKRLLSALDEERELSAAKDALLASHVRPSSDTPLEKNLI